MTNRNHKIDISHRKGKTLATLALIAVGSCGLSACAEVEQATTSVDTATIQAENVWSPELTGSNSRAVYLTIVNSGDTDDRLISVQSEDAGMTTTHQSEHHHGMVRMQEMAAGVVVPAHSEVEFKPGETHIMMIDVKKSFELGDTFPLVLVFEKSGELEVAAEVKSYVPE